ncbi:thermopsin precursor, partial [mine drainage metagenome]
FVASGLPAGTVWAVDFNGSPVRSSEPTISIAAANGTFVYSLAFVPGYLPAPAEGFVAVKGAPITLSIQWRPFTTPISFVEAGLPAGTPWSLRVDGTNLTTTNMTQGVALVNGSYSFTVAPVSPFVPVSPSGMLNVTGVPQFVAVRFSPETGGSPPGLGNGSRGSFAMTFYVVGLPPKTSWTLTLDGVDYPLEAAVTTADLSLGNHTFRVEANGYTASPASGVVGPHGSSSLQIISFSPVSPPAATSSSPGPAGGAIILLASPIVWGALLVAGASVWWLSAARRRPDGVVDRRGRGARGKTPPKRPSGEKTRSTPEDELYTAADHPSRSGPG